MRVKKIKREKLKRYWQKKWRVIALAFLLCIGGGHLLIQSKMHEFQSEVSAKTTEQKLVIPGGMPIGIYLETNGIMVLGTDQIQDMNGEMKEPFRHKLKAGDYITEINSREVHNKEEFIDKIKKLNEDDVDLEVVRNGEKIHVDAKAVNVKNNEYKLGIWVRDNTQGLGTITYLDEKSRFGALGHGIHDIDTSELLNISNGKVYMTSIHDIKKGISGTPGGLEGVIIYNHYNVLGEIDRNTECGVFGKIERIDYLFSDQQPVPVGKKEEIKKGKAKIRCAVEGTVKEYEIEITEINPYAKEVNKGITLKITDPDLLEITGGIVQGMSGSPIIQNGKIIGAVTHVFVNNPKKGYGIFIEEMLQ